MDIPKKDKPLYITSKEICETYGISNAKLWRIERDADNYPDFPKRYEFTRLRKWDRAAIVGWFTKHHAPVKAVEA